MRHKDGSCEQAQQRPNNGCCGHVANVTAATRQQSMVVVRMHWGAPQAATSCQALRSLGTNQRAHLARVLLVRNDGGSSSGSAFIGGFVLRGVLVGTLGALFAPQISKALAGTDKKELLKKLPNFIYDEEKALEKTRQKLAQKIAELNSAIDDVSSHLKSDDDEPANGVVPDETEAFA
ncbi:inner membrane localized protein [Tanacetum coccineum]|uniref:Inner membrane localized protein n=1 Tax=Tanacetum coccineum TaxID=301880 RepID=A0ABQ5A4L9_9ASTR